MQRTFTRRDFLTSSALLTGTACLPTSLFAVDDYFKQWQWGAIGMVTPATNPIVQRIYPMDFVTKLNKTRHVTTTDKWMDEVRGRNHRIKHGHHLFLDGMKVLRNKEHKFGHFLYHLGVDFLTSDGIPNPLLPNRMKEWLVRSGVTKTMANKLVTISAKRILGVLGGSLSLLVAGSDVYACFADTIPHTWSSVAWHGGIGALDLLLGCFPPNPFLLLSAGAEFTVAGVTAVRTLIDVFKPLSQRLLESAMVAFPMWGQAATLSALFGACMGYWTGDSWERMAVGAGITFTGSMVGSLVGHFAAPFVGAAAGFLTGLLLRQVFLSSHQEYRFGEVFIPEYFDTPSVNFSKPNEYFDKPSEYFSGISQFDRQLSYFDGQRKYFQNGAVVPIWQLPEKPIGRLEKDGELILYRDAILNQMETKQHIIQP